MVQNYNSPKIHVCVSLANAVMTTGSKPAKSSNTTRVFTADAIIFIFKLLSNKMNIENKFVIRFYKLRDLKLLRRF